MNGTKCFELLCIKDDQSFDKDISSLGWKMKEKELERQKQSRDYFVIYHDCPTNPFLGSFKFLEGLSAARAT